MFEESEAIFRTVAHEAPNLPCCATTRVHRIPKSRFEIDARNIRHILNVCVDILRTNPFSGSVRLNTLLDWLPIQMSALGQERPFAPGRPNVRFAPKAVIRPQSAR
jgi:hypothetical protein